MQHEREYDLADLEAFVTVCETGSMTDAAKRMAVTESAISHIVRRMERNLGVTLFDRSVRPLKMTVLGNQLFQRGQKLLGDAADINHELRTKGLVRHAHLGIGIIETLGTWFAGQLIQELAANAATWTIVSGGNNELWKRFYARELSALIVLEDDEPRPGAVKRQLLRESIVLATPPKLSHLSLQELAATVPFVGAHANSGFGKMTSTYLSRLKIDIPRTCSLGSLDGVLMMVAYGFGWALVPSVLLLRVTPERHQVSIRSLSAPAMTRRVSLATREHELGALPDLIEANARRVFVSQIERTNRDHPELGGKLLFEIDN
ncbi:MAG: transcriptional regulator [Tardiphaga sp.]|jgi:DNA-binding transcriptional LysR family regulator|uniref:LysR family transcriptional regulator n=1 Tax=Tardiphaga sp. TaxID=1926292 RepID=UPI00261A999E|nr:LysR family transcriptional regulator [Tardiphaga sp.]MDB5501961.1 transcriptional regulator [Tardiphaga sp.]